MRALLVSVALLLAGAPAAVAATIKPNTTADPAVPAAGVCSLRQAVLAAGTATSVGGCPPGDVAGNSIVLAPSSTYMLTLGYALQITGPLTITGAGSQSTTVSSDFASSRVFYIAPTDVSISALKVTGGRAEDGTKAGPGAGGGGIRNAGHLTLTDVVVENNRAGAGGDGFDNKNTLGGDGGDGGGIDNANALTMVRTAVRGNRAGRAGAGFDAVSMPAGTGGQGGRGGGVFNAAGATLALTDSSITGNRAGAGGQGGGGNLGNPPFAQASGGDAGSGGRGGGLYSEGTLSVATSALTGNAAGAGGGGGGDGGPGSSGGAGGGGGFGGGAFIAGSLNQTITNSTIAGNAAGLGGDGNTGRNGGDGGGGGGLASAFGSPLLLHATVAGNQPGAGGGNLGGAGGAPGAIGPAGGIYAYVFSGATLQNTIVAGNGGGNCLSATPLADNGHNLSFPDASCPGLNANPQLGTLQDNGGPTQTLALGPGSAAIDRVPVNGVGCPLADQRGTSRPQGPACDVGAFELAVVGAAAGTGTGTGGGAPPGAPGTPSAAVASVGRESLSPTAFRAAPSGPSALPASRRYGTTVSYTLDRAASVHFVVTQALPGRRGRGGACNKPSRSIRRGRRCTRLVQLPGGFALSGAPGANRFRFTGRLAGGKLKPQHYQLIATPSTAGTTGRAVSASFRVIR